MFVQKAHSGYTDITVSQMFPITFGLLKSENESSRKYEMKVLIYPFKDSNFLFTQTEWIEKLSLTIRRINYVLSKLFQ